MARWTQAGTAVTYLVLTDGQAGGFDDRIDGELQVSLELVRDIVAVIRVVRIHLKRRREAQAARRLRVASHSALAS